MKITEHLMNLVAQGKLEHVIIELKSIFSKSKTLNEVILQSARFSDLKEKIRMGTLDYETASISKNKITLSVLELITEIDNALEEDEKVKKELENHDSNIKIFQKHTGKGDNIGRDKIINN